MVGGADPADGEIPQFPPLLILHWDADTEVSVALAHCLYDSMQTHGSQVEMHIYPGARHVFSGPYAATYSASDDADFWKRTIEFLRRRLAW